MVDIAADIIAAFLGLRDENTIPDDCTPAERRDSADAILLALTSAGYRLLGPDELDPVTVRKCVDVAVQRRAIYEKKRAKHSILADESLTRFEMYDHTVEAHEWLEEQLKALTGGDGNG